MNDFPNEHDAGIPAETADMPALQSEETVETAKPEPERPLFVRVGLAYHELLKQLNENQNLVHEQRVQIASLRARIRELVATEQAQDEGDNEEDELRNNKLMVQTDDCNTLIRHAEQIRENIHHNTHEAETLLAPMRNSMDLLSTRIQYIRTMEQMVTNVREGIRLKGKLNDADALLQTMEHRLFAD